MFHISIGTKYKEKVFLYLVTEWRWLGVLIILLAAYFYLALPVVFHGPYNTDDGWYLNDAWLTWSGHFPYRDFAFPQPPLTLIFHGFFQKVFGPGWYIGRIVSMAAGSIGILLVTAITRRIGGIFAGILSGFLLAFSPWYAVQMVSVNTFSLAILFLLFAVYSTLNKWWPLAGFFVVATIWTRLPLVFIAPFLFLFLIFHNPFQRWRNARLFLTGILVGLVVLVLPFLVIAPGQTFVNVVGFHAYTRRSLFSHPENIIEYIKYEYLPLYGWLWAFALTSLSVFIPSFKLVKQKKIFILFLLSTATFTALGHLTAINIGYDTPILPLLAISGGYGLALLINSCGSYKKIVTFFSIVGLVLSNLGAPLLRYVGQGDNEESMANIQRVATYVRKHSVPDDLILTPEQYISIEAARHVIPGWGIGRFSYFPEFSQSEVEKWNVINDEVLQKEIQSRQARFIIINIAHRWQNAPRTAEEADNFHESILSAGYQVIDLFKTPLPAVEQTRIYERI